MATNQITINFTPCSPAESYHVFYREVGDISFTEWPDVFTSSPIVFEVEGPVDQLYEGYIRSDCGEGVFGPEVPWETTGDPPTGSEEPGCCDPVVIDAEAETIVPDESGSESGSGGGDFLRLVNNVDMSGESVSDWNAFFGTTFSNVVYSSGGTVVDLYVTGDVSITDSLFFGNTTIVRVLDFADCLVSCGASAFSSATNLIEVQWPVLLTLGDSCFFSCGALQTAVMPLITEVPVQGFASCFNLTTFNAPLITVVHDGGLDGVGLTSLTMNDCTLIEQNGCSGMTNLVTFVAPNLVQLSEDGLSFATNLATINLPSCTTIGVHAFRFNTALTSLTLPVCSDLGGTAGDDEVFDFIVGQNIVFTLLTATAGDTDVSILQANNSVTLILV